MEREHDLYHQILHFNIDEGTPDFSFEARLARENGWSPEYTRRVILEYRRFLYLAMTAGHIVTPSDQVDQAWHLHLTYTRSYWQRLCGEVLGQPLHHTPTSGSSETPKYHGLYEKTLATYRRTFGQEPPPDIWPRTTHRFNDTIHSVRVNQAENWIIPKAAVRRAGLVILLALVVILCGSGCAGVTTNPFSLVGMEFFTWLLPGLVIAFPLGFIWRYFLRGPGLRRADDTSSLGWAAVAYLSGGVNRLISATLARLVAKGKARVSADGTTVESATASRLTSLEAVVFYSLPLSRTDNNAMAVLATRMEQAFAPRAERLRQMGYLLSPQDATRVALATITPVLLVLLGLCLPRLIFAFASGKPFGFLFAALVVGFLATAIIAASTWTTLTRRGQQALAHLRATHERSRTDSEELPDAGLSVGLLGTAALVGSDVVELEALSDWFPRQTTDASSGCGSGCGAAPAGGGGCGGGGCGGGCGGCGGCGG